MNLLSLRTSHRRNKSAIIHGCSSAYTFLQVHAVTMIILHGHDDKNFHPHEHTVLFRLVGDCDAVLPWFYIQDAKPQNHPLLMQYFCFVSGLKIQNKTRSGCSRKMYASQRCTLSWLLDKKKSYKRKNTEIETDLLVTKVLQEVAENFERLNSYAFALRGQELADHPAT